MTKTTTVVKVGDRSFRFNEERCLVEWFHTEDFVLDGVMISKKGDVIDCIGLSKENWEKEARSYCQEYAYQLDEEYYYLKKQFESEGW